MAGRARSAADRRRRTHGQNLLVDTSVVGRLLSRLELADGQLVVDVGAGRGALTIPLARAGARVLAIERDRRFAAELQHRLERVGLADRVQIRRGDLRHVPMPAADYRIVANPPFALTTSLLRRLLDDPPHGPTRADLLLQWEVARKLSRAPAATLQAAGWAPWWHVELGEKVPRTAFRPVPSVDAGWLIVVRRDPPLLPWTLAEGFADLLRPAWQQATAHAQPVGVATCSPGPGSGPGSPPPARTPRRRT